MLGLSRQRRTSPSPHGLLPEREDQITEFIGRVWNVLIVPCPSVPPCGLRAILLAAVQTIKFLVQALDFAGEIRLGLAQDP